MMIRSNTPEAIRQRAWRERHPGENKSRVTAYRKANPNSRKQEWVDRVRKMGERPFWGLDGEGGGTDELGRQRYQLLCASNADGENRILHSPGIHLSVKSSLEFILALPSDNEAIKVGYYFGYDITQILRGMPDDRIKTLFLPHDDTKQDRTKWRYVYYLDYAVEYMPRQYLRVARLDKDHGPDGKRNKVIRGSHRTINEVGTFFQKPFVQALQEFEIKAPLGMIGEFKDKREQFEVIGEPEKEYCLAECKALAQLMNELRRFCTDPAAGENFAPREWRGAGHIAAKFLANHGMPKRSSRPARPKRLEDAALRAYFGGRFEVLRIGHYPHPVYEYDINSAYPAAMEHLPCPLSTDGVPHSKWRGVRSIPANRPPLYLAHIHFSHDVSSPVCNFPIRLDGRLKWPREGNGWYWSTEIEAAIRAGSKVEFGPGYIHEQSCDCCYWTWVPEKYEYRQAGPPGAVDWNKGRQGYPIKLGLNAMYGKLAQHKGGRPFEDRILAGLVTAGCRAQLIDAYAGYQDHVIMMATDGIFLDCELPHLPISERLGEWEHKKRADIFIAQAGIYWSSNLAPNKTKTRGIPQSVILDNRDKIEAVWSRQMPIWHEFQQSPDKWLTAGKVPDWPHIRLFANGFIGMRLADQWNKPYMAGCWYNDMLRLNPNSEYGFKRLSFDWSAKRDPWVYEMANDGNYVRTFPLAGNRAVSSKAYEKDEDHEIEQSRVEADGNYDCPPPSHD